LGPPKISGPKRKISGALAPENKFVETPDLPQHLVERISRALNASQAKPSQNF
jgi:hypothetical protein